MTTTPERTPAEELRAAADELRAVAKRVPTDMEGERGDYYRSRFDHADLHPGDVAWIGLVHPGLAEPLAAWLEYVADRLADHDEDRDGCECAVVDGFHRAFAVVRVLNGSAS